VTSLLPEIADERLDEAEPVAGRALDVVRRLRQETVDGCADRPVAQKGDVGLNRQERSPP
jgi:hypothetical protein